MHLHRAGRQGAGLVEHDRRDRPRGLQRLGTPDHDAELGGPSGPHEEGRRRGQPEGAGTGDDQHTDRRGHRGIDVVPGQQPDHEGEDRDRQHHRDEHRRDLVREPLDRCLACLGVQHRLTDPGQQGVAADAADLDDEASVGVEGAADDFVTDRLLDREALAGDHRLVDGAGTLDHTPVGGHLGPGTHQHPHPRSQLSHLDLALDAVVEHSGPLRPELEQCVQRRTRPGLRAGLEVAPEQQEGGDRRRHLEVEVHLPTDQLHHRPRQRHEGAERDEGVHRRRQVAGVDRCGAMERPPGVQHDRGGQHQLQPRQPVDAGGHGQHEHGQGQGDRDDEAPQQSPGVRRLLGHRVALAVGRQRGGVAGVFHGLDQGVLVDQRGVEAHPCRGGREVDAGLDALEPVELLLHPRDAGGAGHPTDEEVEGTGLVLRLGHGLSS